jgi:hypothetical protein
MVYGDCPPDVRSGRSNCLITAGPCAPVPPITRIIFFVGVDLKGYKSRNGSCLYREKTELCDRKTCLFTFSRFVFVNDVYLYRCLYRLLHFVPRHGE